MEQIQQGKLCNSEGALIMCVIGKMDSAVEDLQDGANLFTHNGYTDDDYEDTVGCGQAVDDDNKTNHQVIFYSPTRNFNRRRLRLKLFMINILKQLRCTCKHKNKKRMVQIIHSASP